MTEAKNVQDPDKVIKRLSGNFRRSLLSAGSNNSPRPTKLKAILTAMGLDKDSVFADLGCGVGLPCIYAALLFGCKTYGVDLDLDLVSAAREYAEDAGIGLKLCTFEHANILHLTPDWFDERKITHVFAFDEVFLPSVFERMRELVVQSTTPRVVASTNRPAGSRGRSAWGREEPSAKVAFKMLGGTSSHTMYVYRIRKDLHLVQ